MEQVTVSKIFPAGAGWQAASIVADAAGHQADSLAFAAYTGVGDGIAVAAGHTSYYAAKKAIVDPNINIGEQAGLGVWLGSAAVCSGALWQPLVNALQASEKLPFNAVMGATMVGCGGAFLTGLRVGRFVFPWMPGCDNGNFSTDAYLSMAIGGGAGVFVRAGATPAAPADGHRQVRVGAEVAIITTGHPGEDEAAHPQARQEGAAAPHHRRAHDGVERELLRGLEGVDQRLPQRARADRGGTEPHT